MAFQQHLTSVPLLNPNEDVESSFLELRREIGMYHFSGSFTFSHLPALSTLCVQHWWSGSRDSLWSQHPPDGTEKPLSNGIQNNKDLKGSIFEAHHSLSVENSSRRSWSLAGRGHTGLDTGLCNPLNLHWTGVGHFKSQTSFWCRDRRQALELHSHFSSAEILKQFIPWSGCCWVCWSCPFFLLLQLKNYSWRRN